MSQTATLTVNPPAQATPWASGLYTIDGTLAVDGQTPHVTITSQPGNQFTDYTYLGSVVSQVGSGTVVVVILFDKNAVASGNTITYTGVDASTYANISRSLDSEPIVSGTMTLTLSAGTVGATVSGTINFTTTQRTLTATFTGTVLSITP